MKNTIILSLVLFALVLLATTLHARPSKRFDERTQTCRVLSYGQLDWDSEPWGRGGQKFKEVCKSCHFKGNDKGATFLHAESKSSKGWNRVFTKRRAQCAKDGSWAVLTEEEIQLVNDYLFRNSADSFDPFTNSCG